jgi:hypothetical protein
VAYFVIYKCIFGHGLGLGEEFFGEFATTSYNNVLFSDPSVCLSVCLSVRLYLCSHITV